MEITLNQATQLVMSCLRTNLVPMLHSSPGIGKSSLAQQIADDHDLVLIDIRLSYFDPVELNGLLMVNKDKTKAGYLPMDFWPLKDAVLPEGKKGWLIFFDEITSAPKAIQSAAYKIILDKMVGNEPLHDKVAMLAAGNLMADNAVVNEMSTALQSRMVHFHIQSDLDSFVAYANKNGLDHRVISYLQFEPDALMDFDPDHNDFTFPCPRTWEFVSRLIKPIKKVESNHVPLLVGTVGKGRAYSFKGFLDVYASLVSIDDVIANPNNANVPTEPTALYAITGTLAHYISDNNADKICTYIDRLPPEFQIITMQNIAARSPELIIQNNHVGKLTNKLSIDMVA